MKKMILLIQLTLLVFTLNAQQYFVLTPTGFRSIADTTKNYVVLEFQSLKQEQIFDAAQIFLHNKFRSPRNVISPYEKSALTIKGYSENAVRRNKLHVFDMDYTISFQFKDGRVKIDAPFIDLETYVQHRQILHIKWTKFSMDGSDLGIYGSDDNLKSELAKNDLETFFNSFISEMEKAIRSNNSMGEW